MQIRRLQLQNFRNFEEIDLEIPDNQGINIMLGQNAQGKTNLLESIFLLSFPKSFRVNSPLDLIRFQQNFFTIQAELTNTELRLGYQKKPVRRTYKKDGAEVPLAEYLTSLQTVLFTPEAVELLGESPSERRRFLDTILSQIDREYFLGLIHYTKILKQRNALLKRIAMKQAKTGELKYWDQELSKSAMLIHLKRKNLIEFFTEHISDLYAQISNETDNEILLQYEFSGHSKADQDADYATTMLNLLNEDLEYELSVGHTTAGPHRDDFGVLLNQRDVAAFCSRGEKRSFVLVLKMLELQFFEKESGKKPILLLDDVFSELDNSRRNQLLDLSKEYQTFISTVEESYFKDYSGDLNVFKFENNSISRYN